MGKMRGEEENVYAMFPAIVVKIEVLMGGMVIEDEQGVSCRRRRWGIFGKMLFQPLEREPAVHISIV